jgi:serine protease inhibitor
MYEFMSAGGNVVSFDLDKVCWVKTNYPKNTLLVHFGRNYEDLSVECVDFPTAQALADDISKNKEAYHKPEDINFKVEEV